MEMGLSLNGFNPTLVRLRHRSLAWIISGGRSFQSHAGSIEAVVWAPVVREVPGVSIPRWFD